jgi:UBX domain-containing protein 1
LCREIPAELAAQARGRELQLEMEDHRQEEFVAPKTKAQAFTGAGRLLGR